MHAEIRVEGREMCGGKVKKTDSDHDILMTVIYHCVAEGRAMVTNVNDP
jgi:hypothetical protein